MPRQPAVEAGVEPESETITYTRQKPKRKPLPAHFPRQTIVHDIEDKTCDCCGHDLHRIGEETNEQLEFIPAQIKVIEHVRPKYGCRHCERQGTEVKIRIAPVAPTPIPKSIATASLLAQIITSKYQYALPLYRQEQMFKQFDIDLNRKTLAEWTGFCSCRLPEAGNVPETISLASKAIYRSMAMLVTIKPTRRWLVAGHMHGASSSRKEGTTERQVWQSGLGDQSYPEAVSDRVGDQRP